MILFIKRNPLLKRNNPQSKFCMGAFAGGGKRSFDLFTRDIKTVEMESNELK